MRTNKNLFGYKNIFEYFLTLFYQIYRDYIFLKKEDIDKMTEILLKKIIESSYKPDIVVAIEKGGLYHSKIISKKLKVKLASIGLSCYSLKILGIETEHFPIIKTIANFFGYQKKVKLIKGLDMEIKNKKILIVDDDSNKGNTIKFAIDLLNKHDPKEIKTAVLCVYHNAKFIDFSIIKGYQKKYFEKRHRIMPWEKISPYYFSLMVYHFI